MRKLASFLTIYIAAIALTAGVPAHADESLDTLVTRVGGDITKAMSDKSGLTIPNLSLIAKDNFSMNLTYSYREGEKNAEKKAQDIVTYGFNSTAKLGGKSSLKTMFYMADPRGSGDAKSDEVLVQEGEFGLGKVKVKLGFQNVGEDFKGFASLRDAGAAPGEVLSQLEKEKGMQRLDMGAEVAVGRGMSFSASQNQVKDKTDDIVNRSFGFTSKKVTLGFTTSEIGAGFSRFKDIKEADRDQLAKEKGIKRMGMQAGIDLGRGMSFSAKTNEIKDAADEITSQAFNFSSNSMKLDFSTSEVGKNFARAKDVREGGDQLAKEVGMKRTNIGLGFASSGGKDAPGNSLGFSTVEDESGKIDTKSMGLNFGKLGLNYFHRATDSGFSRLGSLSKDDMTKMALEVRQQFDRNANVGQVTDQDRAQVLSEAGIERTNMQMNFNGSMKSDLQMLQISDGKGSIDRKSASISGDKYSLSVTDQTIDETFEKLGVMAPVEKAAFGNERGMHRTNIAGGLKMSAGDLCLGFSKVTDTAGESVLRQSLGFAGKKLNVQANIWDIDDNARVGDLADADREQLRHEQGFKGMNILSSYQISEKLGFETLYYSSENGTAGVTRDQMRNKITWKTGFGANIGFFRDQYNVTAADGTTSGYLHNRITFERAFSTFGGLGFNALQDTKTTANEDGSEVTATINEMHLESNKSKNTVAGLHRKMVDFGNGKIENTQSFNMSSKLSNRLNLTGAMTTIDRGEDGSEDIRSYGVQWSISSRLNFAADVMDKDGSNSGPTAKRSYTLSGFLTERFSMFRDVKIAASHFVEDKDGALLKAADAFKLEANLFKGNFVAEYSSAEDASHNKPMSRGFSFSSDKSDGKRLTFDVAYKTRDLGPSDPFAVRNYGMNYKISPKTSLSYSYFSYREKPDGKVEPVGGTSINLSTMIRRFSVTANFKQDENYLTGVTRDVYGLAVAGKLGGGALIEFGYSLDDLSGPGSANAQTYRFKYDHQVNADHFLTLTGELKAVNDAEPGTKKDLTARIDLRRVFN